MAATAPPPQTETTPAETAPGTENQGPIPFVNHKRILENARVKTEQEVTQKFQQQYAPHIELGERFRSDPVGSTVQAIQDLIGHAEYGPQIVSALARTLGSRRTTATETVTDSEPQADLETPDGLRVYSAEQQAKREAWLKQEWLKEVDQRLQPLQSREQQAQAAEREERARQDSADRMSKVLAPFKALPEFVEHKDAIRAKTGEFLKAGHNAETALGLAVAHVLRDTVLPTRAAQSRDQLVAEAVKKSTGSTSAPGATPAAPAGRPRDFESAFKRIAVQ